MKKQTMTIDEKLNSVRAGVLGSNDGILTVVGVLFSVSAASGSSFALLIASLANLISGAFSMACKARILQESACRHPRR